MNLIDIGCNLTHDSFDGDRAAVLQRYLRSGATVLDTAHSGAIQVRLVAGQSVQTDAYRDRVPRYWH